MSQETDLLDSNFVAPAQYKEFDFPIEFSFKIGTLANDFIATDANGKTIAYVRQKMFKFKEAIMIYTNDKKLICCIKSMPTVLLTSTQAIALPMPMIRYWVVLVVVECVRY